MNRVEKNAYQLLKVIIESDSESYLQTGKKQFENKWLHERIGLDVDDLNVSVEYLEQLKAIQVYRTLGQPPFDFTSVAILSRGKVLYDEFKDKQLNDRALSLGETKPRDTAKVFVVHGRNSEARDAIFQFLRSIGLKPIEWSQAIRATGKVAPYIGEVLDAAFSTAQAVVVLMTPDDFAFLREELRGKKEPLHETQLTPQARPNVLFEAGMAMGRHPDRTVLIELGELRPFSDVAGRHTVRINNSTEKRQDLADRLEIAGCQVDLSGRDWHSAGDFDEIEKGFTTLKEKHFSEHNQHIPALDVTIDSKKQEVEKQGYYIYWIAITIKNIGDVKVNDFRLDVEVPSDFLDPGREYTSELGQRNTLTHRYFRITNSELSIHDFLPGDELTPLWFFIHISQEEYTSEAGKQVIRASLYSGEMLPRRATKSIDELIASWRTS